MVRQQVQYIRYDTVGSAARKPVPVSSAKKAALPKPRKQKRRVIYVDPVAIMGIAVAVFMLVMMTVGIAEFLDARQEAAQMEQYVAQLSSRNTELNQEYESGYGLEAVEKTALALGMVPSDQVQMIAIQVEPPQEAETLTVWERIGTFLTGLFA